MNDPTSASVAMPTSLAACPVCGAKQHRNRKSCWMCGAALGPDAPSPGARPTPFTPIPGAAPHAEYSFSLSTLMLITTLVAVCCGLLSVYPGLGVVVCILLVPVLVRTAKVVRRREEAGGHVSATEKIALGATSFAVTIVIAAVVGFATFLCFCAVCATLFGVGSGDLGILSMAIGAAAGAAVAILVSVQLVKWSRRRYQRDVEVPPPHEP